MSNNTDRHSTPAASSVSSAGGASSSLRPPRTGALASTAGHQLRASADMGALAAMSPLANRGIRPASEVYLSQFHAGASGAANPDDVAEKVAQQWIADIDQYENTLEDMAAATLDQDFKDELAAIEQWFRVLSEPERTAALYALLQQTTQVQVRFFIQVLQQMAKSHPMSGVLSPAAFAEKDPMASRMSDAMSKLHVDPSSRASYGFGAKPPPSPGGTKRNSGLDPSTIKSMFPDAANAIEDQKAEFQKTTGTAPKSNRNSAAGDRASFPAAPTISGPSDDVPKKNGGIPDGPWRHENQPPIGRPKSSSSHQLPAQSQQQPPMGQFGVNQPASSGSGLRTPRPFPLASDVNTNIQSTTVEGHNATLGASILSPFVTGGSWASAMNTPMVPNFNAAQSATSQADMVANATAMKLAALSTVNNRIQLDDARKYRRARSTEGQQQAQQAVHQAPQGGGAGGMLPSNILMTNEYGQVLTPQQAAALQQQQIAALAAAGGGRRSRPASPGIAITGPAGTHSIHPQLMQQNNGFLSSGFDGTTSSLHALPNGASLLGGLGSMLPSHAHHHHDTGYLSDASGVVGGDMIPRGRSPRGRRGSSKPPEDPTDPQLLRDIPNWLRSLRLHKYTENLKDVQWQELVRLDEAGLEARGVAAKGARTKLLKVFEQIREAQQEGRL